MKFLIFKTVLRSVLFIEIFLCACLCVSAQDKVIDDAFGQSIVARVSTGNITLDQILEQFGPAWYEITGRAKAGLLSPAEVDRQLQDSWHKALDGALKDEAFYQEAMRNFELQFQKIVDGQVAGSHGSGMPRKEVEQRLRQMIERQRHDIVQKMIEYNISKAGGFDNLARMLKSRGLTFENWKQRIIRKAYTYQFLFTRFEPMGKSVQPSPGKVLRYYKDNPDKFTEPGNIIFRQIFFDNKNNGGEDEAYKKASEVYTALARNELSFTEAVAKYSEDKISAANGGLEQNTSTDPEREIWLADLRQAVSEQAPGKLGPVLISPRGCHIAVLVRKEPGRLIPFKLAQKMILEKMESDKWQDLSDSYYKQLKNVMHIEVLQPRFPDKYSWNNLGKSNIPRRIGFDTKDGVGNR